MKTYPLYIKNKKVGSLTVTSDKPMTVFHAECDYVPEILRISIFGNGKSAYLGVMQPKGEKLVLNRKKTKAQLASFPNTIEYAADCELAPKTSTCHTLWRKAENGTLANEDSIAIPCDIKNGAGLDIRRISGREYIVFRRKRKVWKT